MTDTRSQPMMETIADRLEFAKPGWLPISGHVVNFTCSLDERDTIVAELRSHATIKARAEQAGRDIEGLKASLREIKAKTDGDRPTVNPENAFEHWGKLNAALVSIRGLVREALEAKP